MIDQILRTKSLEQIMNSLGDDERGGLQRSLHAKDLIALGIGAIIGAGIFASTGTAAAGGGEHIGAGPAVVISYVLVAIACGFCALCYAEFASLIPIAGSAYTYAYATLGELVAWIIGWDLILEYAVGNVAVAVSWSDYFNSVLRSFHCALPDWMATATGVMNDNPKIVAAAPVILGHHIVFNLPALLIVASITALLVRGVKESITFNNAVVLVKLLVIFVFIGTGSMFFDHANWVPFAPNGFAGIQSAAAVIFFAYIGFDAVSTAAEETVDPGRNLPIGMIGSLVICTALYILVSGILTGMVNYKELGTGDPMAHAFELLQHTAGRSANQIALLEACNRIVGIGAVFSMTAVLLVFQLGQPRIFFSMARDGLLPQWFAKVHPKYHTPYVTTIFTGVAVGVAAAFLDISFVIELCNIGTLFAFVIVSASILLLRFRDGRVHLEEGVSCRNDGSAASAKRPYQAGSVLSVITGFVLYALLALNGRLNLELTGANEALFVLMGALFIAVAIVFWNLPPATNRPFETPLVPFTPMFGILACLWLMLGLPMTTWIRFFVWLFVGLGLYGFYGLAHSRLNIQANANRTMD